MSYTRCLDEYTDLELATESDRREKCRAAGKCSYCGGGSKDAPCKFPERHPHDA